MQTQTPPPITPLAYNPKKRETVVEQAQEHFNKTTCKKKKLSVNSKRKERIEKKRHSLSSTLGKLPLLTWDRVFQNLTTPEMLSLMTTSRAHRDIFQMTTCYLGILAIKSYSHCIGNSLQDRLQKNYLSEDATLGSLGEKQHEMIANAEELARGNALNTFAKLMRGLSDKGVDAVFHRGIHPKALKGLDDRQIEVLCDYKSNFNLVANRLKREYPYTEAQKNVAHLMGWNLYYMQGLENLSQKQMLKIQLVNWPIEYANELLDDYEQGFLKKILPMAAGIKVPRNLADYSKIEMFDTITEVLKELNWDPRDAKKYTLTQIISKYLFKLDIKKLNSSQCYAKLYLDYDDEKIKLVKNLFVHHFQYIEQRPDKLEEVLKCSHLEAHQFRYMLKKRVTRRAVENLSWRSIRYLEQQGYYSEAKT